MDTMKMSHDEAVQRLTEIATGDKEIEALKHLIWEVDTYRHLYEQLQLRLTRFKDVAGRPDIPRNTNAEDFKKTK